MVRKRRLQDLILLLLRIAILALLVLMFARPYFTESNAVVAISEGSKSRVILLDNSYSMQFGNYMSMARNEAAKYIDQSDANDEIAVVVFSDTPEQLSELNNGFTTHKAIVNDRVTASFQTTDYYKALKLGHEILKGARHTSREIVLVSDFQGNGWQPSPDSWQLPRDINVVPVIVGVADRGNAYIDDHELTWHRNADKVAVQYGVSVKSQNNSATETAMQLWRNNLQQDQQRFLRGEVNQMFFQERGLNEGLYQGFFTLQADPLSVDDRRYFSYQVDKRPGILCLEDRGGRNASNTFFLKSSFDLAENAVYDFAGKRLNALRSNELRGNAMVFLANPGRLSTSQKQTLQSYVENGGTVLLSAGSRTTIENFSEILTMFAAGQAEEVVQVREVQSLRAILAEVSFQHPIFDVFAENGANELFGPKFSTYLKVLPDSSVDILARFDSGNPALLEKSYGNGKLLMFTSSLNTDWGDFPVNEVFLPFLYQLARYGVKNQNSHENYLVGEPVLFEGAPGDEWLITTPEDGSHSVMADEAGEAFFRETNRPGNYLANNNGKQRVFSVNLDVRESDLTAKDPREIVAAIQSPLSDNEKVALQENVSTAENTENRQKVWRYLLFLLILLFLTETYLASRSTMLMNSSKRKDS